MLIDASQYDVHFVGSGHAHFGADLGLQEIGQDQARLLHVARIEGFSSGQAQFAVGQQGLGIMGAEAEPGEVQHAHRQPHIELLLRAGGSFHGRFRLFRQRAFRVDADQGMKGEFRGVKPPFAGKPLSLLVQLDNLDFSLGGERKGVSGKGVDQGLQGEAGTFELSRFGILHAGLEEQLGSHQEQTGKHFHNRRMCTPDSVTHVTEKKTPPQTGYGHLIHGVARVAQNMPRRFCSGAIRGILECQREDATVKFCVLASGSSGNAALVSTGHTRILVDAGLSMRELRKRLATIGESLDQVDAILITHEHSDHVSGLPVLARNKDVRAVIHMTRLTGPAIDWGETQPARLECFQAGASFQIGDIEVQSFGIPHDAIDPVGYTFEAEGVRIGIATDLGYIPESIKFHLRRADMLLLEANHDLDMLKVGPYPWSVKQRVMSRVGHLSNLVMSDYLLQDLDACTSRLILGHLSEQNNHPEIVRMIATQSLEQRGLATSLAIAEQGRPSDVFCF